MATLNITYDGRSGSVMVGNTVTDVDVRMIAAEVMRYGSLPELHFPKILASDLDSFVVDRFQDDGKTTIYLRPRVPFGEQDHEM